MLHVEHRIQRGVVVHLQLPVLLKPALARQHLLPQTIQPLHQVVALLDQDVVALPVPLGMAGGASRR